jgi:hypothetical protein
MATQKDGGLVARAVREAVGTLVSPAVYGQLVGRALQASGLTEIPESGAAIAAFIEGALLREVEQSVGVDAAELVAEQLAPIVAHASVSRVARVPSLAPPPRGEKSRGSSRTERGKKPAKDSTPSNKAAPAGRDSFGSEQPTGVASAPKPRGRRSDLARTARLKLTREQMDQLKDPNSGSNHSDPGHTARPEPGSGADARARTQLFGASSDGDAMRALGVYLMGTAHVSQVDDLVGLLDALEEPGLHEPIVLLDCRKPTVHVTSIAAIGEDLPRGTTIVLWGASEEAWRELDRDRLPEVRWVRCSVEATTDDVGSLCQMLVGSARR